MIYATLMTAIRMKDDDVIRRLVNTVESGRSSCLADVRSSGDFLVNQLAGRRGRPSQLRGSLTYSQCRVHINYDWSAHSFIVLRGG